MKLWEAKKRSKHSLGHLLNAHKMKISHSTIKCPMVLFENAPKFSLFSTSKLHFEKGFEAQSFLDAKSAPNSTYSAN